MSRRQREAAGWRGRVWASLLFLRGERGQRRRGASEQLGNWCGATELPNKFRVNIVTDWASGKTLVRLLRACDFLSFCADWWRWRWSHEKEALLYFPYLLAMQFYINVLMSSFNSGCATQQWTFITQPPVASNSDCLSMAHAAPNNWLHIAGPYSGSKLVVMNRIDWGQGPIKCVNPQKDVHLLSVAFFSLLSLPQRHRLKLKDDPPPLTPIQQQWYFRQCTPQQRP